MISKAKAGKITKVSVALGICLLATFLTLAFIPGEQGEFWFFFIGMELAIVIPVFHYGILRLPNEQTDVTKNFVEVSEGRHDAGGPSYDA